MGFIQQKIQQLIQLQEPDSANQLMEGLIKTGGNLMDMYIGSKSPAWIVLRAKTLLKKRNAFSVENYFDWIMSENKNYKVLTFDNETRWTFRPGENKNRYIHIHPAKHSPETIRVRANTLKSAICVVFSAEKKYKTTIDVDFINETRKTFLDESPVKAVSSSEGLGKLLLLIKPGLRIPDK